MDALRSKLFLTREARLDSTSVPKGHLSPGFGGLEGDVFVATQGQLSPRVPTVLRAVDPLTGEQRWQTELPTDLPTAPVPSANGSTVFVPGECMLRAYSAAHGELVQSWSPGTMQALQPVPLQGSTAVVAGWKDRYVAALAPGQKEPVWETEVGTAYGPAVTGPGRVYASVYVDGKKGAVQALDADTGRRLWRHESETPIYQAPATGPDGTVYVSENGSLVALNPKDGQELWEAPVGGRATTPVVSKDGERVLVGDTGGLQALDAHTGQKVWRVVTSGAVRLAPGEGPDDLLCVATEDRRVTVIDGERGAVLAEADMDGIPGASPLPLEDGSFLVWNLQGTTVRARVLDRPAEEPHPAEPAREIRVEETEVEIGSVRVARRR